MTQSSSPAPVADFTKWANGVTNAMAAVTLTDAVKAHQMDPKKPCQKVDPEEVKRLVKVMDQAHLAGIPIIPELRQIENPSPSLLVAHFQHNQWRRSQNEKVVDTWELTISLMANELHWDGKGSLRRDTLSSICKYLIEIKQKVEMLVLLKRILQVHCNVRFSGLPVPIRNFILDAITQHAGITKMLAHLIKTMSFNLNKHAAYHFVGQYVMTEEAVNEVFSKLSRLPKGDKRVELLLGGIRHALHDKDNQHKQLITEKLWAWVEKNLPATGEDFKARFSTWESAVGALTAVSADSPLLSIAKSVETFYQEMRASHKPAYTVDELARIFHELFRLLVTLAVGASDIEKIIAELSEADEEFLENFAEYIESACKTAQATHCTRHAFEVHTKSVNRHINIIYFVQAVLRDSQTTSLLIEHLNTDSDDLILRILSIPGLNDFVPCDADKTCIADLSRALYEISTKREGKLAQRLHRKAIELSLDSPMISNWLMGETVISDDDAAVVIEVFNQRKGRGCNGLASILLTLCEKKKDETYYPSRALAFDALQKSDVKLSKENRTRFWALDSALLDQAILNLTRIRGKSHYAAKVLNREEVSDQLKLACLIALLHTALRERARQARKEGFKRLERSSIKPLNLRFKMIPSNADARALLRRACELGKIDYHHEVLRLIEKGATYLLAD